jgi:hypothetical protein
VSGSGLGWLVGWLDKTLPQQQQNCSGGQKNGKAEVTPLNSLTYTCVLSEETLERLSR